MIHPSASDCPSHRVRPTSGCDSLQKALKGPSSSHVRSTRCRVTTSVPGRAGLRCRLFTNQPTQDRLALPRRWLFTRSYPPRPLRRSSSSNNSNSPRGSVCLRSRPRRSQRGQKRLHSLCATSISRLPVPMRNSLQLLLLATRRRTWSSRSM